MTFQKIVLVVATVFLIICLVILSVILGMSKNKLQFPPELGACPDYFKIIKQGNEEKCNNVKHLGNNTAGCNMKSFHGHTNKDKKKWANRCGVTWDGITNR